VSHYWPPHYSRADLDRILAREEQKWAAYCRRAVLLALMVGFAFGFLAAWLLK
jgi:hypothetical protein